MSTRTSTTIRVSLETYDALSKHGSVADTFDDVIRKLLKDDKVKEKQLVKEVTV